jgi:hypothetical protein
MSGLDELSSLADFARKSGFGAGDRIRTGDIDLGKVALYQLSYSRAGKVFTILPPLVAIVNWVANLELKTRETRIHPNVLLLRKSLVYGRKLFILKATKNGRFLFS